VNGKASADASGAQFAKLAPSHLIVDLSSTGSVARFSSTAGMTASALDKHIDAARATEVATYLLHSTLVCHFSSDRAVSTFKRALRMGRPPSLNLTGSHTK
jgi:hypothetical protein